jgi:hypothetical protein
MKTKVKIETMFTLFLLMSTVLFLHGCAVYSPAATTMVTIPEIITMSKEKVPSKDIIHDIKKTHTVYRLDASQYAKLQANGVSDSVVNYMQQTHLDAIRWNQQMNDAYYNQPYYNGFYYGGFGYGWPYGYYAWPLGPSIMWGLHGYGHHGGEYREHSHADSR